MIKGADMKLKFCVACGAKDDLQHHHLVTRAEGGSDNPSNLITLCSSCHHKLHERQTDGRYNHSQRTKDAFQAAKARGKRLGNPRLEDVRKMAVAVNRKTADAFAANVRPIIHEIQASGVSSFQGIARALAARGVSTARGGRWTARMVINVLAR